MFVRRCSAGYSVITGLSYRKLKEAFPGIADYAIYTSPIDRFFTCGLGAAGRAPRLHHGRGRRRSAGKGERADSIYIKGERP